MEIIWTSWIEDAVRCIVNVTKRYVVCSVAKGSGFCDISHFFGKVFLQTLQTNELSWNDCLIPCLLQEWEKNCWGIVSAFRTGYYCDNAQEHNISEKGQRQLNMFWDKWKNEYTLLAQEKPHFITRHWGIKSR